MQLLLPLSDEKPRCCALRGGGGFCRSVFDAGRVYFLYRHHFGDRRIGIRGAAAVSRIRARQRAGVFCGGRNRVFAGRRKRLFAGVAGVFSVFRYSAHPEFYCGKEKFPQNAMVRHQVRMVFGVVRLPRVLLHFGDGSARRIRVQHIRQGVRFQRRRRNRDHFLRRVRRAVRGVFSGIQQIRATFAGICR